MTGFQGDPPPEDITWSRESQAQPRANPAPEGSGGGGSTGSRRLDTACLVWVAPGQSAPSDLLASLNKRGVRPEVRHGPLEVMAAVCVMASQLRERAAGEADRRVLVIFCHASQLMASGDVYQVITRCVGNALCWEYRALGDEGEIRAVTSDDAAGWPTLASAAAVPTPRVETKPSAVRTPTPVRARSLDRGPKLRLAGEVDGLDDLLPPPVQTGEKPKVEIPKKGTLSSDVLTAEELAMLLRDPQMPPPEGPSGGGGGR